MKFTTNRIAVCLPLALSRDSPHTQYREVSLNNSARSMPDRPDYGQTLAEYFESKGALDLAFHIGFDGQSFSALEDITDLSPATLSKRLKEGEELGLWTTIAKRPHDGRSQQKYVPTQNGLKIAALLDRTDFTTAYVKFLDKKEDLEEGREQVIDIIRKSTGELSDSQEEAREHIKSEEFEAEWEPPWESSPEPTAEARESIGDVNVPEDLRNPFERSKSAAENGAQSSSERDKQMRKLFETLADSNLEGISLKELAEQIDEENAEDDD